MTLEKYLEKLYSRKRMGSAIIEEELEVDAEEKGYKIFGSELDKEIKRLKNRKVRGVDGIPGEFIESAGDGLKIEIYGLYVKSMNFSMCYRLLFVPLPKMISVIKSEHYYTISFISRASMIFTYRKD